MKSIHGIIAAGAFLATMTTTAVAAPVYLNDQNISVALGAGMAAEPFANRTTAASLASIIDAPSATSPEFHTQQTHVWVSGGQLALRFDFGTEYDLTTLHFWNYHSEGFDVDNIDFVFFDANNVEVGSLLGVEPELGNNSGSDSSPILPQDYALNFPSKVRYVNALLTGSNNQVDFNNIGFTGEVSNPNPVPLPPTLLLVAAGLALLTGRRRGASRADDKARVEATTVPA